MIKGNTKEQILEAALELFSVKGFEATSISQIAEAVGIRKASLYSHFASKQEILDTLIEEIMTQYNRHSFFAAEEFDESYYKIELGEMTPAAVAANVKGQLRFVMHDPVVKKARKMLVIEQFQNPELAAIMTKRNYSDVMRFHTGLMRYLISNNILKDMDAEIMAAHFCLPVTVWLNLCDREPGREDEIMSMIDKHVEQFYEIYKK